jgi:hypothetical protein
MHQPSASAAYQLPCILQTIKDWKLENGIWQQTRSASLKSLIRPAVATLAQYDWLPFSSSSSSFQFRLLRDASFRRPDEFDQRFHMLGVEPLRFDRLESL